MEILQKIEDAKIRGIFTGRNRIIYPGAFYHLTQRAPGREVLFLENSDYLHMLSLIKEISISYQWNVFCFVLMPNHLHLLLQIQKPNLSKGAKELFERYAKYFNAKFQRKGPVFCKPYRVSLCVDESYLLVISLYIHLNPYKAKLTDDPMNYKWSSVKLYTDKEAPQTFVKYDFILGIIEDNLDKAKNIYKKLLLSSSRVEFKSVLEDPTFIKKFKLSLLNILSSFGIGKREKENNWSLDREIAKFQNKKCIRQPQELNARRYLVEQMLANGYKIVEIASFLKISRQSVYNILQNQRRWKCKV
ncbi:MAG: transposase [Candidatus Omnitrophica bacterium]|nr:transposase [Candidatus Omnitrophota bacterium]